MYIYDHDNDPNVNEKLKEYFGSLILAIYALFQCVSGGISWREVGSPLTQVHWTNGFVLSFFIFFMLYVALNIITGIFLDSAVKGAQADRHHAIQEAVHSEKQTMTQMQDFFKEADKDKSGTITIDELHEHLKSKTVRAHLKGLGIEVDDAPSIFRLLDLDGSGEITIQEFVFGCMKMKGNAKSMDVATLIHENRRTKRYMSNMFNSLRDEMQKSRQSQEEMTKQILTNASPISARFSYPPTLASSLL